MNADRKLLLIKHSLPIPIPGVDAQHWRLSAEGRDRCASLAAALKLHEPAFLATSLEPKATETAELVGLALGIPVEPVPGLTEHDRSGVPWQGQEKFDGAVRSFFERPGEVAFGNESANETLGRFRAAVDDILTRHSVGTIAIVAHGTVISLYVAALAGVEPYPLWQRLGLPSFVVLELPAARIIEIVENV